MQIMNLADDMKAISALRSTYRKTSYPAIQSALEQRLAQLQSRYDVLSTKATKLRLQTSVSLPFRLDKWMDCGRLCPHTDGHV